MSVAELRAVGLMLDAGILPILPWAPDRCTRLAESLGSLEKSERRKIKRKYRKLARKTGMINADMPDVTSHGLVYSRVKAHEVFRYIAEINSCDFRITLG